MTESTAGAASQAPLQTQTVPKGKQSKSQPLQSLSTTAANVDDHGPGCSTQLSASSAGDTLATFSSEASARCSTARTSALMGEGDDDIDDSNGNGSSSSSERLPIAYPAVAVLQLTSDTASSSALPDTFGFSVSRGGSFVIVYSASNVWVIRTSQLPRLWARTLHVSRKPVAIDITEDGALLAVLSRPAQVDLYDVEGDGSRQITKRRTVLLVHEASTMAISPDGLILITGNKFGIEVVAIGPGAPESCRRTLSAPVGDTLEFSEDGRTLLVTSYARKLGSSAMFMLPGLYDGPLGEDGEPMPTSPEVAWTTLVLFPESTRIARQATLLRDAETSHIDELFAFNAEEDTWGIYDMPTQRFTRRKMFLPDQQRWTRAEFLDDSMPAVSPNADFAAVALRIRGTTSIWIYQVPGWDFKPSPHAFDNTPIQPCFKIPIMDDKPSTHQEITCLRWVRISDDIQRLLAVGNISPASTDTARPCVPEGSKAVLVCLDFDRRKPKHGPQPEPTWQEYDLDPLLPGEKLPEGSVDFDREVELARTRTIAQRRAELHTNDNRRLSRSGSTPVRAHTSSSCSRRSSVRQSMSSISRVNSEELTMEEAQAAFEAPYDNTQPRSQNILTRAATVAAVSPANRRHLRALPFQPLEYRRADGMRDPPHESDADNWVPPPPAYTKTAEDAQSVSLSHPTSSSRLPIPPVPALPPPFLPLPLQSIPMPQGHYQLPGTGIYQSTSSTDLSVPPRRPSLLHPSTFPAPQMQMSGRRGSSASRTTPRQLPCTSVQVPTPSQISAYNETSRYTLPRPRRPVESLVELRPSTLIDPATGRRGSAPDVRAGHAVPGNHGPVPLSERPSRSRRMMLPRLTTAPAAGDVGPVSAPPRTNAAQLGERERAGPREAVRERKWKVSCGVM